MTAPRPRTPPRSRTAAELDADALAAPPEPALADALSMNRRHMSARLLPELAAHGLLTRSGDRWGLVADLEAALIVAAEAEHWRRRAEVAEAIAAERADALADALASLALAQRLAALTITENVTPIPQAVEQTTGTPSLRRWLPRRWR